LAGVAAAGLCLTRWIGYGVSAAWWAHLMRASSWI